MAVHRSGNLTDGAASTGEPFSFRSSAEENGTRPGCLLAAVADGSGCASASAVAPGLHVWDVIGRAAVLHAGGHAPDAPGSARAAAAVLARAAAVGSNTKRVCACDGTVIWDATPE